MARQFSHLIGGPVLYWELVRAHRHIWHKLLVLGYSAWLVIQFSMLLSDHASRMASPSEGKKEPQPTLARYRQEMSYRINFSREYVSIFLRQQLLVLLVVTPAVVGGALGKEKEGGTLLALLGTELTAKEIVIGKLLGRMAVMARIAMIGMPALILLTYLGEMGMRVLLLAFVQAAVLLLAVGAACMLCSVWVRNTRDAILACYAAVTLAFIGSLALLGNMPVPVWLNPLEVLQQLCNPPFGAVNPALFLLHLWIWGGAGALCLILAIVGLRRAALRQMEHRTSRWIWAYRPQVGGNPVRWREHQVIGLAPLPVLRIVPRWMAMVAVFTFSCILVYSAVSSMFGSPFKAALRRNEVNYFHHMNQSIEPTRIYAEIVGIGVILVFIGTLVVAVRCATSISEEKRRKTWEDLLLTPLTLDEIVAGKKEGVLQATVPYLIAYSIPMLAFSTLGGIVGIIIAVLLLGSTCVCMFVAAELAMSFVGETEQVHLPDTTLKRRKGARVIAADVRGWGP